MFFEANIARNGRTPQRDERHPQKHRHEIKRLLTADREGNQRGLKASRPIAARIEQRLSDQRVADGLPAGTLTTHTAVLGSTAPQSATAPAQAKSLVDSIGVQAIRVEQTGKSYEDKKQLLLDFSKSLLPEDKPAKRSETVSNGRRGAIRKLRQRAAKTVTTDLKVRFIGDVIPDTETLDEKAQALRTAVKGDGTKKGGPGAFFGP